jgi:hypothetical protein
MLSRQRNALVHYKIELKVNGTKVLDGSGFRRKTFMAELGWIRRYFSLPYDLAALARKSFPKLPLIFLHERGPIEVAPAHVGA